MTLKERVESSTRGFNPRLDAPDWEGGVGLLLPGAVRRELYRTVQFTIRERLLRSNEKQFQGGLVFKARGLFYHSTLGRE